MLDETTIAKAAHPRKLLAFKCGDNLAVCVLHDKFMDIYSTEIYRHNTGEFHNLHGIVRDEAAGRALMERIQL